LYWEFGEITRPDVSMQQYQADISRPGSKGVLRIRLSKIEQYLICAAICWKFSFKQRQLNNN